MLRLYILRHAKSSWAEAGTKDFDRSLNERGSHDMQKLAPVLRERKYLPGHVYCSPSLRTRMTMHGAILAYDTPPVIDYVDGLYSGSVDTYMKVIKGHAKAEPIMLVGHNPSSGELAVRLAGSGPEQMMAKMSAKFPTGTLAVIDFAADDWARMEAGKGKLVDLVLPREL